MSELALVGKLCMQEQILPSVDGWLLFQHNRYIQENHISVISVLSVISDQKDKICKPRSSEIGSPGHTIPNVMAGEFICISFPDFVRSIRFY